MSTTFDDTNYDRFALPTAEFEVVDFKRGTYYRTQEVDAHLAAAERVVDALNHEVEAVNGELSSIQDISEEKSETIDRLTQELADRPVESSVETSVPVEVSQSVTLLSEATRVANEHVAQAEEYAAQISDKANEDYDAVLASSEAEADKILLSISDRKQNLEQEIESLERRRDALRKELKEILEQL